MAFNNRLADFDNMAERNSSEVYDTPSAYEAFSVEIGQAVDEDIASSRQGWSTMDLLPWAGDIDYTHNDDRPERIKRLIENGEIPEDYLDRFKHPYFNFEYSVDYDQISDAINSEFDFDEKLKTGAELHELRVQELDSRRRYAQEVQSRYDGWFAPLVGGMVGFGTDPLIAGGSLIAPAFYSAGLSAKLSRSALAISMTKRGALIGMGLQAPVEPFIHSWKEDMKVHYSLTDSMFNIAAAGIFSGAIDGIPYAFRNWVSLAGEDINVKTIAKMKEQFIEKGLSEGQADDMATFIYQASTHPHQATKIDEVIGELDNVKEQVDTPVFTDEEPAITVDSKLKDIEDELGDVILTTPEGDITVRETLNQIADDKEMYDQFVGCITNG